jgi:hypothetical protein
MTLFRKLLYIGCTVAAIAGWVPRAEASLILTMTGTLDGNSFADATPFVSGDTFTLSATFDETTDLWAQVDTGEFAISALTFTIVSSNVSLSGTYTYADDFLNTVYVYLKNSVALFEAGLDAGGLGTIKAAAYTNSSTVAWDADTPTATVFSVFSHTIPSSPNGSPLTIPLTGGPFSALSLGGFLTVGSTATIAGTGGGGGGGGDPVPEPSSLALVCLGAIGLIGGVARRRQRLSPAV